MGGDACVIGSWPSAGAAAPRVKPPASVAPLFRSSRRLKRFEPIGLSFADEPTRKSPTYGREYTLGTRDWGLGIRDWGLGIGDWGFASTTVPLQRSRTMTRG